MYPRWRNIFFFEGIVGTPLTLVPVNPIDKGFVGDGRMRNPGVFPRTPVSGNLYVSE